MPAVVTFDGVTRLITEIAAGTENEIDVVEIYSEWKDWVRGVYSFNTETDVDGGAETVTVLAHSLYDGAQLNYSNLGGGETVGLVDGTRYYARVLSIDTLEIYDTAANAQNTGSTVGRVDLTPSGLGNGESHRFTTDNAKFLTAFSVIGGDPITATQNLGITYFLENGWRVRPAELSHKVTLVGNLFTREPGQSAFVDTVGSFTVNAETRVSNLVDSSVARLDLDQLLQAIYIDTTGKGTPGVADNIGTPTNPSDNIVDATTLAIQRNLSTFVVRGTISLPQAYSNFLFKGLGAEFADTIDINGQDVSGCRFEGVTLNGVSVGRIECIRCQLAMGQGLDGLFRNCAITDNFVLASAASVTFEECFSTIAGPTAPVCTFASGGNASVGFRAYNGGMQFLGLTSGDLVSFDGLPASLDMGDSSNTGGIVQLRGIVSLDTDPAVGITVVDKREITALRNEIPGLIWDAPRTGHTTSGSFGEFVQNRLLTVAKFLGLS